jgi:hypothetical protein
MAKCETCGKDYDKAFQVTMGGRTMTFDSFECAIEAMEANGNFFCAEKKGVKGLRDRL